MINNVTEENSTLHAKLKDAEQTIQSLQEEVKERIKMMEDLESNTSDYLVKKLSKIDSATQEIKEILAKKQYNPPEPLQPPSPMYSEMAAAKVKNPTTLSRSAVLIKRRADSKISINSLRNLLNKETMNIPSLPKIHCDTSRDRETLIVRTESEEDTDRVLRAIEEISQLKELADITIKSSDNRKVIILGIPDMVQPEEVVTAIQNTAGQDLSIDIQKVLKRKGSQTYQLILELEKSEAIKILNLRKIPIAFNVCKIHLFKPIIRCQRCQRYGHSSDRCRARQVCQYCTKAHDSNTCPNKNKLNTYRCVHCYRDKDYYPHHAGSNTCLEYKYQIQQRNISSNSYPSPSI